MRPHLTVAVLLAAAPACKVETPDPEVSWGLNLEIGWDELGYTGLHGATVALDTARGERLEAVSDAWGEATFTLNRDLDFPVDVTVDPGLINGPLLSFLGMKLSDDGEVMRWLDDAVLGERVRVRGKLDARTDDTWAYVSAHGAVGTRRDTYDDNLYLRVAPARSFEVVAVEYTWQDVPHGKIHVFRNWTLDPMPPLNEDTEHTLTLTHDLRPETRFGSFRIPAKVNDPLHRRDVQGSMAVWSTYNGGWGNICGFPSVITMDEQAGRFEYTAAWLAPEHSGPVMAEVVAYVDDGAVMSKAYVSMDDPWAEDLELLPVPEVTHWHPQADGSVVVSVDAELEGGVVPWLVAEQRDGSQLWLVRAANGEQPRFPAPPSTVHEDDLPGFGDFVRPALQDPYADGTSRREAWGRRYPVQVSMP